MADPIGTDHYHVVDAYLPTHEDVIYLLTTTKRDLPLEPGKKFCDDHSVVDVIEKWRENQKFLIMVLKKNPSQADG